VLVVGGLAAIRPAALTPIHARAAVFHRRVRDARGGLHWNDIVDRDLDAKVAARARNRSLGQVRDEGGSGVFSRSRRCRILVLVRVQSGSRSLLASSACHRAVYR